MKTSIRIFTPILFFAIVTFLATGFSPKSGLFVGANDRQQCFLLDGDGGIISTTSMVENLTQNINGNGILKCSAQGVSNPTGMAIVISGSDGGTCVNSKGQQTNKWRQVISPNGSARLTCQFE